jgi:hypothetical protein
MEKGIKETQSGDVIRVDKVYVVSESGTIEPLKKVDTLKAMLLVPGGLIIIPSRC